MRRAPVLAGLVAVLIWGTATPAGADPAVPTNYRSEVVALEPVVDVIELEVVGGDAFLRISVQPGHEVIVPGYEDEPYLRIDDTGVWRNLRSPATYLNDDRYAQVEVPATADPEAEPEWERIASGGSWAWHDHRIHWMAPGIPSHIAGDTIQEVFTWAVPLIVDGEPVVAHGRLEWLPSTNPSIPLAIGLLGLAPMLLWRRRPHLALALTTTIAGALALAIGWGQWVISPPDARGLPVSVALPAIGLVLALSVLLLRRRSPTRVETLTFIAATTLLTWVVIRLPTLWKPVLPTLFPPSVDRTVVAGTLWAAGSSAALALAARARLISTRGTR